VNRDGAAETHVHPGGVRPHRQVDQRLDFGELDDLVEAAIDFPSRKAEQAAAEVDVFRPVSSG
jgi:hypothetical protein